MHQPTLRATHSGCCRVRVLLVLALALASGPAGASSPFESAGEEPLLAWGPLEYRTARGLHLFGDLLSIGGFATFELEKPQSDRGSVGLDGPNFLIRLQPLDVVHVFAEIEMEDIYEHEFGGRAHSRPSAHSERLYLEVNGSDALNLRVGKFQTPLGRWNLAPAEPFVWTVTQPALLEVGLGEESMTGVSVFGAAHGARHSLRYWVFGQPIDPFDIEADEDPADRMVGGRVTLGDSLEEWSVGASVVGSKKDGRWSTRGGIEALLRIGSRLELSAEAAVSEGNIPDFDYWGGFLEGSYRLDALCDAFSSLYFVGRLEYFDGSSAHGIELADVGLTWIPAPWLITKVGYRFVSRGDAEDIERGLLSTVSVVF